MIPITRQSAIRNPQSAIRNPQSAIRILAVHSGALGDVVLFGHLLSRLPGRVTIVAGGEKAELLVGLGAAERALDFEALPMHEVFTDTGLSQCRLPALLGPHDRLISCFGGGNPRAELRLAAACGAADAAFLPVRPEETFRGHLLDLWADLLGLPPEAPAAVEPWPVPQAWRDAAVEALRQTGADSAAPYVVISPGAGSAKKCWPVERFIDVARSVGGERTAANTAAVAPRRRARAVFVVGPVECDLWPDEKIASLRDDFPLLVCPPLSTLAGVLAGAQAVVANDSGVGHLAAAVGTRTIALFGPTRPDHFAPLGRCANTLAAPTLDEIPVRRVLDALPY